MDAPRQQTVTQVCQNPKPTANESRSLATRPAFGEVIGGEGVTFDALRLMHRTPAGAQAFATFHVIGADGKFRNVTSWDEHDLDAFLPFAREHLVENSYHSVNAFYRPGREWETQNGKRIHRRIFAPGLLPTYRANKATQFLHTAYVDIDCHTAGLTPGQVLGAIWDMQLQQAIPDVSLVQLSGRGVWLLWFLRDEKSVPPPGELPDSPRAWAETADLYRRVERAIAHQFVHLGADTGATDAARVMRLAGSLNTKAGERVRVLPQIVNGRIPCYTLRELAAHWQVSAPAPIQRALTVPPVATPASSYIYQLRPRRDPNAPRNPQKQAAARARWRYALVEFETLRDIRRGQFPHCRENACFVFSLLLRRNQVGPDALRASVYQLATENGLDLSEAEHAIAQSGRYATCNPSGRYFADQLRITAEEAAQLARWPAAGEQPAAPSVMASARTTGDRRAHMLRLIAERGVPPTIREMTALLTAAGFPVSIAAVGADYKRQGLVSGHPGGRPPRLPLA